MKGDIENEGYRGSCLCGSVTFKVNAMVATACHCHCTMCRKFHGAAFATLVSVEGLQWVTGKEYLKHFKAENGTVRTFCNRCGSSLGFKDSKGGGLELAIPTFDDPIPIKVNAHIFTNYSVNWYSPQDNLPCYGEGE